MTIASLLDGPLPLSSREARDRAGRLMSMAVFLAVFGLNLSFRTRHLGESGLDLQNGAKFAAWALMLAAAFVDRTSLMTIVRRDAALQFLLVFATYAFASALWSSVPAYSAATAVGIFAWVGFALVAASRLSTKAFVAALVAALACEIGLGLLGAVVTPDLAWMPPSEGEAGYRLQGFSGHANLIAEHAGVLLIFTLGAQELGISTRLQRFVLVAMALAALYGSNSRTAMIATAVAVLMTIVRRSPRLPLLGMLLLSILTVSAWLLALDMMPDASSFSLLSRDGNTAEVSTLTGRTELWQVAWGHFLERPIFGWAFNGTERLMADSMELNFPGNPVNAHNMVLQGLMSLGIVGFAPAAAYSLLLLGRYCTRPDGLRDRLVIFVLVLGSAEAECMTVPALLSFLIFWCMARDAIISTDATMSEGVVGGRQEPLNVFVGGPT